MAANPRTMRRGVTVAEALVGASIGLLLIGLLVPILRITARAWNRNEAEQGAQRAALTLAYRLRRDYQAARPGSLVVQSSAQVVRIAFLSREGTESEAALWTPQGGVVWRKWVQYRYDKARSEVRRCETALPSPTAEPTTPLPAWQSDRSRRVAGHVAQFDASTSNSVLLRVKLLGQVDTRQSYTEISTLPTLYGLDTLGY